MTASAAATLQLESGGRAVLGLGRGDSTLTQIGRRPVPVAELEPASRSARSSTSPYTGPHGRPRPGARQRRDLARFSTEGGPEDGLSEITRAGIARLASEYDESCHGQSSAPAARRLEDAFIDRFAVCGPPDEVVERLAALGELGLERVIVVPGSLDADPAAVEEPNERFAADVLPALR